MNKDYMLRRKPSADNASGLDIRPCGMLVQKRNSDYYKDDVNSNPIPNMKLRVKYGPSYHEVLVSSQASFGEMKKVLSGITGEKREIRRPSSTYRGVRDGSKVVLFEDELSRERRFAEARRSSKMDRAAEEVASVRFEVVGLAKKVACVEMEVNSGKKVVEAVVLNLIEMLMTQLIRLDGIDADGGVKVQRRMEVKRVQKYIETLDVLKLENSSELGKVSGGRRRRQQHNNNNNNNSNNRIL